MQSDFNDFNTTEGIGDKSIEQGAVQHNNY